MGYFKQKWQCNSSIMTTLKRTSNSVIPWGWQVAVRARSRRKRGQYLRGLLFCLFFSKQHCKPLNSIEPICLPFHRLTPPEKTKALVYTRLRAHAMYQHMLSPQWHIPALSCDNNIIDCQEKKKKKRESDPQKTRGQTQKLAWKMFLFLLSPPRI